MLLHPVEYTGEALVTASPRWVPQNFAETLMYGNAIPNNLTEITNRCPDFRDAVLSIILTTEPDATDNVLKTLANLYRGTPSSMTQVISAATEYAVPLCFAKGELAAMLAFLKRNQKESIGSLTGTTLHAYKQQMQSDVFRNIITQSYDPNTSEWFNQVRVAFPGQTI